MPGQGFQVHIRDGKLLVCLPGKRNRKRIFFVVDQHILRNNGNKRFPISTGIRDTIVLSLYQKRFKLSHPHNVMLDTVKFPVHSDVAYENSKPSILA